MAFGQNTGNIQPVENEKVQGQRPSPAAMKLAYKPKKKAIPEGKESPKMEAANHPPAFLKRAAMLAGKK